MVRCGSSHWWIFIYGVKYLFASSVCRSRPHHLFNGNLNKLNTTYSLYCSIILEWKKWTQIELSNKRSVHKVLYRLENGPNESKKKQESWEEKGRKKTRKRKMTSFTVYSISWIMNKIVLMYKIESVKYRVVDLKWKAEVDAEPEGKFTTYAYVLPLVDPVICFLFQFFF